MEWTVRCALVGFFAVWCIVLSGLPASSASPTPAEIARGKYIYGATGGCGCHTKKKEPVNSGGRRYDGPFGTVYSSNITPDRETGIGAWTDEQLVTAIRLGRRPNGERLIPVHPYTVFNGMAEEDLRALVAYLRTLPPVNRPTPPKKITVPLFEAAQCLQPKGGTMRRRHVKAGIALGSRAALVVRGCATGGSPTLRAADIVAEPTVS